MNESLINNSTFDEVELSKEGFNESQLRAALDRIIEIHKGHVNENMNVKSDLEALEDSIDNLEETISDLEEEIDELKNK